MIEIALKWFEKTHDGIEGLLGRFLTPPVIRELESNTDSLLITFVSLYSMKTFGSRIQSHWSIVFVSGLLLSLVFLGSFINLNLIINEQLKVNEETVVVPPLDYLIQYDIRNVTQLFVQSGPDGRKYYAWHLVLDTICIPLFLWFHRSFLSWLAPDDDQSEDDDSILSHFYWRLPAIYTALDFYENVCGAAMLMWFEYGVKHGGSYILSAPFVSRVALATMLKITVLYALVAFETVGLVRKLFTIAFGVYQKSGASKPSNNESAKVKKNK